MKRLTKEQAKRLVEENLTNKFMYHLDNMMDEKRPFGNSGFNQIQNDMMHIIGENKKWNVSNEEELDELKFNWMKDCFDDIKEWVEENYEDLHVELFVNKKEKEE